MDELLPPACMLPDCQRLMDPARIVRWDDDLWGFCPGHQTFWAYFFEKGKAFPTRNVRP